MDQPKSAPVNEAARNSTGVAAKNVVETARTAGKFTTFAASVEAAGLTDVLSAKGPFTVFAPTDEAFANLPSGAWDTLLKDAEKLKAVLNYHVVSGRFLARAVRSGEVMTLQGSPLTAAVAFSNLRVNGALVTQRDVAATNGIVHAIDAVILPKGWQLTTLAT